MYTPPAVAGVLFLAGGGGGGGGGGKVWPAGGSPATCPRAPLELAHARARRGARGAGGGVATGAYKFTVSPVECLVSHIKV